MKRTLTAAAVLVALTVGGLAASGDYFAIRVVDAATGRGVPLVELRTVSGVRYWTDSSGLAAFLEPGLIDQRVWFSVESHGYEMRRDGFGNAGIALDVAPGKEAEIRLDRRNIAERLYRVTGEGIYRDTLLLGRPAPIAKPTLNGQVSGQDSVQRVIFGGRIHWFWGDTMRPRYPLGHFWMAGATSALPGKGGLDPAVGIELEYFQDAEGISRPMWPRADEGPIWSDGFVAIPDRDGRERLVAHHSKVKDVGQVLGHGVSIFDDEKQRFAPVKELALDEHWRCLSGHPVRVMEEGTNFLYLPAMRENGLPFPAVRVRATLDAVLSPEAYEAWTPLSGRFAGAATKVERDAKGALLWAWKKDADPLTAQQERELIAATVIRPDEARYQPQDVDSGKSPRLHAGSVSWNEFRHRWIAIAVEEGGSASYLGEVWIAEADSALGPWRWAKKIATHARYSFYNPVHHPFFDQDGGRMIYFEGTYANTFSGNPERTPRYDYNQIMYRIDLADPRLKAMQER